MQIAFGLHVLATLKLARNVIIIRAHKKSPFARRHGADAQVHQTPCKAVGVPGGVLYNYNYIDYCVVLVCCDLLWKK